MTSRSLHVAVIGAGAAGLVAARELRREGHKPVVFERAAGVGGTWLYDPDASADLLGAGAVHSSVYASLRTNLSRECFGFSDFPFVADEGGDSDQRRFPGHAEVLRYLQEFARRFDLYGMVRLSTEVVSVRMEASASWRVLYSTSELAGGSGQDEEVFDAVVVCNGHFVKPRVANIAGIGDWPGKQMHSHSYRVPDAFHGQVVVVVGYKTSGLDISRDIASVAREVHVAAAATTCVEMQRTARPNLWLHPMIERAEADGSVVFQDGNRVKADAILYCTGYEYSFPFLDEEAVGISVDDNRVGPLYKHVFPPHLAPHISFVGLPFASVLCPLFELQSNWVAGILSGRIELPSQEEMKEDVAGFYSEMEARGRPKRFTHDLGACTFEYEDWVAEQCGKDMIPGWRKAMYLAARKNMADRPESCRDEWEDAHLLLQAYQDLSKYL